MKTIYSYEILVSLIGYFQCKFVAPVFKKIAEKNNQYNILCSHI